MSRGIAGEAALAAGMFMAACGPAPRTATTVTRVAAPAATATPAAATPTPAATPAPPPPLLVVLQPNAIEALDGAGTPQWSFDPRTVVGAGSNDMAAYAGGSHLLLTSATTVTVIDRRGVIVGHGATVTAAAIPGSVPIHPDPTGTRWAWATLDHAPAGVQGSTAPADRWSGAVWVAGIGEAPHRVESWTEPAETTVEVFLWSDRGIVTAVVPDACAPTPQEASTALLDPNTGRSTPLQGGDRHVVDVHAGLVLAMRQPETLLVSGAVQATLTEQPARQFEHLAAAAISPDGAHVFASMTSMSGCGGEPEVRTAVLDPATHHAGVLPDVFAVAWFDDAHLVVRGAQGNGLRIVDLAGAGPAAPLVHGVLVGVLR